MLYQTYMKFFPIALPASNTFKDQVAVATGGTSGLGLAAAIHLINLGAAEVIISSRNVSHGQEALESIDKGTDGKSKGKVTVLELDMTKYGSVVAFAEGVKKVRRGKGGVDAVLLNAGVIGVEPKITDEGWEENLQVNTLSTTLLATLLLPWMKEERENRTSPAHLGIVGSGRHLDPNIKKWAAWASEKKEGVLEHLNKRENWPGAGPMYGATKLLAQYAFEELAKRAFGSDRRPQVIMNIMCPGVVKTGLTRHHAENGPLMKVAIFIFTGLFGKSASNGARTYMAALTTKESEHGKFVQFYKNETQLKVLRERVIDSNDGKKMQAQVWGEISRELMKKVPEVRNIVEAEVVVKEY